MPNSALLVLECPWWKPKEDTKRSSVLPFLNGLERRSNEFNIYYATFYDNHGLARALENDLIHTTENRQILYIAAHGERCKLADDDAKTALKIFSKNGKKIEGILLGCCAIGRDKVVIDKGLAFDKDADLYGANWLFSYKYYVDWSSSMLLDLSILENVFNNNTLKSKKTIIEAFKAALTMFNKDYEIASDEYEKSKKLYQSIRLMVRGKGAKYPTDVTKDLLLELGWIQKS